MIICHVLPSVSVDTFQRLKVHFKAENMIDFPCTRGRTEFIQLIYECAETGSYD